MTPEEFRSQLEAEFAWRQDEILFLQKRRPDGAGEDEEKFNKTLIVMLYSHFEGFAKFCFDHYARAISEVAPKVGQVGYPLAAAALGAIFRDMRDTTRKSDYFRHQLPTDGRLHLVAREAEFLERLGGFEAHAITAEGLSIDTESNLTMSVLRRNLYLLGLNPEQFDQHDAPISEMVGRRHKIAHGAERQGVATSKYEICRNAVFEVMKSMMIDLTDAVARQRWLRPAA